MKKTGLLVLLLATAAWAQTGADAAAVEAPQGTAPTTASFPDRASSNAHLFRLVLLWLHQQTYPAGCQLRRRRAANARPRRSSLVAIWSICTEPATALAQSTKSSAPARRERI